MITRRNPQRIQKMSTTDKPDNEPKKPGKHSPTAMDIYKYLWKGRDFELDHLWQRSVFLAAFVLAVAALYTGYMKEFFIPKYAVPEAQETPEYSGTFFLHTDISVTSAKKRCASPEYYPVEMSGTYNASKMLTQNKKEAAESLLLDDTTLFGLIPIAITLLGLAFSVLWITMAKGSKAWYELYESNIAAISGNAKFWEGVDGKNRQLTECFDKKNGGYKAYLFGNLENQNDDPIDSKLFSAGAGPFSVSKINTMIGIISLTAFLCAFGFHVYWAIKIFNEPEVHYGLFTLVCFTAELIAAFFIVFRLKNKVRSSFL